MKGPGLLAHHLSHDFSASGPRVFAEHCEQDERMFWDGWREPFGIQQKKATSLNWASQTKKN